jgi:DNA processing protein
LPADVCEALNKPDWDAVDADLRWLETPQSAFIPRGDSRYPARLLEIPQAPLALFCLGDVALLNMAQIAIVGARSASPQGLDNAREFAAALAQRGLVVSSGLAMGIDGAAHRGVLDADGLTLAVCGNGLDRVYPARHRDLARAIAAKGLLVSEFSPGTPPKAENFPRRNRIISGMSLGVLVVEAARASGSLITARLAAEQGREVFAIPGSIHNPMARGCPVLIRQGAKLVENIDDILEDIAPQLSAILAAARPDVPTDDNSPRGLLLAALGDDPISFDSLAARSGLGAAELNGLLLELELNGDVASVDGGLFMRRGSREHRRE